MLKRLHSRYAILAIILVLLAFLIAGIAFFVTSVHSSYTQKQGVMQETLKYSVQIVPLAVDVTTSAAERQMCYNALTLVCDLSDTDLTIADMDGMIAFSTSEEIKTGTIIKKALVSSADMSEPIYSMSTLDGALSKKHFVLTAPVIMGNGVQVGAIFVTSDAGDYANTFIVFFRLFLFSAIGALLFSCILIYYLTKQQVKPIKAMCCAAQKYAHGDMSPRIEETGVQEIDELVVAFNNMADSLSHLEDTRRAFLQNVSHDMRTPMTTISGFVDGILDGTIPPEQYNYYLGLVSNEAKRLTRLVSTMLEMSEIESGKTTENKAVFDICEVVTRVVLSFENQFVSKNLKLKMDIPPEAVSCFGNNDAVYRIIYNLVENAIKYSFDEGLISVSLTSSGAFAIVTVRNTGMGIKADDLPFIFDRFYKTDKSRGLDTSSMGLGLYITKTLVEKNGGNIVARSQYGEFCEFSFTVPLHK